MSNTSHERHLEMEQKYNSFLDELGLCEIRVGVLLTSAGEAGKPNYYRFSLDADQDIELGAGLDQLKLLLGKQKIGPREFFDKLKVNGYIKEDHYEVALENYCSKDISDDSRQ